MPDLPIERLIRHKLFFGIARDGYDCGSIEKGSFLLRRKIVVMPDTKRAISDNNCLSLAMFEENIEELEVRVRLADEGKRSLERLRAVELRMERYLMKHASLNDLMVVAQR
jgi:hypothetical protein